MDASGSPNEGNYKFMAIVIGAKEDIDHIIQQSGYLSEHMNRIENKKNQDQIISALRFHNQTVIAFCIQIDKYRILNKINIRKKNTSKKKILQIYNQTIFKQLREKILDFLYRHNYSLDDIVFQCDSDCKDFAKDVGLKYEERKGNAFYLSDIIAWANNKNKEPKGVMEIDLTKIIETKLKT